MKPLLSQRPQPKKLDWSYLPEEQVENDIVKKGYVEIRLHLIEWKDSYGLGEIAEELVLPNRKKFRGRIGCNLYCI